MSALKIDTAAVLCAGLATRMRPMTDALPKALIEVAGETLLDHALDHVAAAGIPRAVVNVHHCADLVEAHALARRAPPAIAISDERAQLMDTGGGLVQALPTIGTSAPFLAINGKILWTDGAVPALTRLARAWDDRHMDALLLLVPVRRAMGYAGPGDFFLDDRNRLDWRGEMAEAPYVYSGIQIVHPRLLADRPRTPFSMRQPWHAAWQAERLFGLVHDGDWAMVWDLDGLAQIRAQWPPAA